MFFLTTLTCFQIDVLGSDSNGAVDHRGDHRGEGKEEGKEEGGGGKTAQHQLKANERIQLLELEVERYKERERLMRQVLAREQPQVQQQAAQLFQKAGIEQSSVCSIC